MSELALPPHAEVAAELHALAVGMDASELHGSLCGFLSGGGDAPARDDWLSRMLAEAEDDPEAVAIAPDSALDRMYVATADLLASPDFGFTLLLPPADADVAERGEALLGWCRGFLGGFGLAAGAQPPLSDESRDALADLGRIAGSELSYEDPDTDEEALEEVAEFVRVAALLLHSDCVLGPRHRRSLN
jgi:yecA family protein